MKTYPKKLVNPVVVMVGIIFFLAIGIYAYQNKKLRYEVTQYPLMSGKQGAFYTITGSNHTLIVIDGGWKEDASYVRQIIKEQGNHVTAWFITHPHRDHAGAFNEILKNPMDIQIDAIYDNGFDYDFVESVGEPYDDITIMEEYYALTKDDARVNHLSRGQELQIAGIQIKILNAFDSVLMENVGEEKDYQNNGALLFYVKANEEKGILFCSDVKWNMQSCLADSIANLSCKAVQVGHHGNWGFSKELYETTGADTYFFDAPDWIMQNKDYPANALAEELKNDGGRIFDFSNAPHRITFE